MKRIQNPHQLIAGSRSKTLIDDHMKHNVTRRWVKKPYKHYLNLADYDP